VRERLGMLGFEVVTGTTEGFATFIARELERVARVIKHSGIRLE
jgi:hypothetical protein